MKIKNILKVDSSMRRKDSVSRDLTDRIVARLSELNPGAEVIHRDLANGVEIIDEQWVDANFTPVEERSATDHDTLANSESLVNEIETADAIVIGVPIYNFGVPGALKLWIDLVVRARRTFRYSEGGPEGLVADRPVYLAIASGGVALQSEMDYTTPYLTFVLGFIGLRDIRIIDASGLSLDEDAALERAGLAIRNIGVDAHHGGAIRAA